MVPPASTKPITHAASTTDPAAGPALGIELAAAFLLSLRLSLLTAAANAPRSAQSPARSEDPPEKVLLGPRTKSPKLLEKELDQEGPQYAQIYTMISGAE
jgi:hypothetical protein